MSRVDDAGKVNDASHVDDAGKVAQERERGSPKAASFRNAYNVRLDSLDVLGLEALGATHDVELHALTFLERTEAVCADCGEVNENIFVVALTGDEAEALCVVEPLNCALFHVTGIP
jgi:hypothetical protein